MVEVMQRDPVHIPGVPGVFTLLNKRRRFAYVAWTQNLQKRSHALAHMLDTGKSTIRALPMHDPGEYVFVVNRENVDPDEAQRAIDRAKRLINDKGYKFIDGSRDPVPLVELDGKLMSLTEAIALQPKARQPKYTTAWRRIQRGWTIEEVLGIEPPPPRWGKRNGR